MDKIAVQTPYGVEEYLSIKDERVQKLLIVMKNKGWGFVRNVPNIAAIHHLYCIMPVAENTGYGANYEFERAGCYVFNFSLVEQKTMLTSDAFAKVIDALRKIPEPNNVYIGPLPKTELDYRMKLIEDQLSVMAAN